MLAELKRLRNENTACTLYKANHSYYLVAITTATDCIRHEFNNRLEAIGCFRDACKAAGFKVSEYLNVSWI